LVGIARPFRGRGGAGQPVKTIGCRIQRAFVFSQCQGWLICLQQHIAQQLARRHDRAWRDRMLVRGIFEICRGTHERPRLLPAALSLRQHGGCGTNLHVHLTGPIRVLCLDQRIAGSLQLADLSLSRAKSPVCAAPSARAKVIMGAVQGNASAAKLNGGDDNVAASAQFCRSTT
jgi:hypothetical protein